MSSKGEQPGPAFVVILALTQIVAWGGTYYPVSVLSKEIAAGLHVKAAVVTAAPTVLLLGTALASLPAARLLGSHGPRRVMALATAMGAAGLAVVATGPGWEWYLAGWAVAGLAGAAMLTLGAQVAIATFRPATAPRDLRLIMLATCLAPTIFWPVTDLLSGLGWRGVFGVNGGLLAVAAAALWIVLPAGHGQGRQTAEATSAERLPRRPLMALIGGVSLNGFVSSGLPLVFIPLFVAAGLDRGMPSPSPPRSAPSRPAPAPSHWWPICPLGWRSSSPRW